MQFERREICTGVYANILQTDKFKRNFISVNFVLPHKKEYAAVSSLLGDVLTRATGKFPELKLIERELDECYGAQLSAFASLKGESKIVTVSMESLCNCYATDDTDIFERSSSLLYDVIFNPYFIDGCFGTDVVESEKEKLLASVGRRKNSKSRYALDTLKAKMCAGEPYGVFVHGSEEDIQNIDEHTLTDFYTGMLSEAAVELFYVGSDDPSRVISLFEGMFGDKPRQSYKPQSYPQPIKAKTSRFFFEEADYKQSVLTMGYRVDVSESKRMRYAFSLFNALFGSGVNSKLFKIVREKMHLCYYASCSPDLSKGVAFISSGIDASNENITKDAILEQFAEVAKGNFTDEDVEDCKRSLSNAYKELYDSPDGLCAWYLSHYIYGDFESIESVSENINSVTRREIMRAAACMELDTVFVLRGVSKLSCDGEVSSDE